MSLKLGALINVANLCSILRSKFNEAPRLIYAERFWLHFTDCLRGRHPLVAEAPSWDLDRDGCPLKFSGESATFELFDCPAVSIKPSKDINRLQPLELPAPAMACGSGSVETSDPLVKGYEIAFCGLNLGFGLMHSKTIAADTIGAIRCDRGRFGAWL